MPTNHCGSCSRSTWQSAIKQGTIDGHVQVQTRLNELYGCLMKGRYMFYGCETLCA